METIKSEYKQAFDPSVTLIRDAGNRFLSIDFPSERLIDPLSAALRQRYQDKVLIVNMSEREYECERMPGHVLTVNFRGLPAPPLEMLTRLCLQIHQWLSRSDENVVAVHCFPGLSRTMVLIVCYFAWSGQCLHPVDALPELCSRLGVDDSECVLPSQKRYLNYFFDLLTSSTGIPNLPPKSLGLSRLILNGVPNIPVAQDGVFRPFFEVWKEGHLVHSSLPADAKDLTLEQLVVAVPAYPIEEEECVVMFETFGKLVLAGDVLFRLRHLSAKGGRFTCLRFAFNTNHVVDNLLHFSRNEIDGNTFSACVVDAVFESVPPVDVSTTVNGLSELYERSFQVSSALRAGGQAFANDETELITALQESTVAPRVIGAAASLNESNDVDDFFAQLEKEAQM